MPTHTFRTDDLGAWRRYYDRLEDRGPYHQPDYLALLERFFGFGDETAELFVYEDGEGTVYYPYLVRSLDSIAFGDVTAVRTSAYSDIVSSWYYGGPLRSPDATASTVDGFRQTFSQYCREVGIVAEFVRFDPNVKNHAAFDLMGPEFNRETVPVDLSRSKDDIWDRFEKRNRNAIRQAQASPLVVEPTREEDDYRAFHRIYSNAMEARDASEHYRFEPEFFVELLSESERASLLVARDGDAVVGGSLLVHDERIAHDYVRASNPDYWDQRVNNLLCYEALMHMRNAGREWFDFQGGRPGVFRFKKGFSPARREFYISRHVHLADVYEQLIEDAATAGIDTDTGYFPAYRVERSN